jgi:hypothetical protein
MYLPSHLLAAFLYQFSRLRLSSLLILNSVSSICPVALGGTQKVTQERNTGVANHLACVTSLKAWYGFFRKFNSVEQGTS